MKVVIDTNVVVFANLSDEGLPAAILDLAANKTILMFVSPAILAEYEAVLRRPQLSLSPAAVASSLAVIRNISRLVKPPAAWPQQRTRLITVSWNVPSPPAPTTSSPATPDTSPSVWKASESSPLGSSLTWSPRRSLKTGKNMDRTETEVPVRKLVKEALNRAPEGLTRLRCD